MDAYNCRGLLYPTGQHVTFYSNTINKGKKCEKLSKSYKDEKRTDEEEKHCINVSLKKTKNNIYKLARANEWEWFITITFDRQKTDSSEYEIITNRLQIFLENLKKRKCPNLKYLIVPELHADGEHYHFHGLLSNVDDMKFAFSGKFDKKSNKPIFNILDWKWGYTTATRVEDTARVSSYITKYITKECVALIPNKKRYYASRNLEKPIEILTVQDEEDFQKMYSDRINFCKTIKVKEANQKITYYETEY